VTHSLMEPLKGWFSSNFFFKKKISNLVKLSSYQRVLFYLSKSHKSLENVFSYDYDILIHIYMISIASHMSLDTGMVTVTLTCYPKPHPTQNIDYHSDGYQYKWTFAINFTTGSKIRFCFDPGIFWGVRATVAYLKPIVLSLL
jgi:hypothetical protein